jgi:hypothetical protein
VGVIVLTDEQKKSKSVDKNDQKRFTGVDKNEMIFSLKEIRSKYKLIATSDIEMLASVYYPVAILEMNVDEITFEDFDSVQLAVLGSSL